MTSLSREEKLDLMRSLNWDYLDTPEDMLAVVEERLESSGAFNRETLFARSLERLHWDYVVLLWGPEKIKQFNISEIVRRIWPKERRRHFDFALGILRREPVSTPGWGAEYYVSERRRFFSNRGYGP